MGLPCRPDKIRAGDCKVMGECFDFLGYRFEAGKKHVRKKSRLKPRARVRQLAKRSNGKSLTFIIDKSDAVLRGWHNCLKGAGFSCFNPIDGFIRRRVRAMLAKRSKIYKSFGGSKAARMKWLDAFFRKKGHISLVERAKAAKACRLF
jgi:RNA-directed DNA polymerase